MTSEEAVKEWIENIKQESFAEGIKCACDMILNKCKPHAQLISVNFICKDYITINTLNEAIAEIFHENNID